MARPVISLLTDFGEADGYVGAMKGVILGICPEAVLVDISHQIQPQAVPQAAYVLATAAPYFPVRTVHLVVVDPGVGGQRRPIAVQTERTIYVAPDNGVLSLVLRQDPARLAIHLTEALYQLPKISATFHGRDTFAPAAAHLARGLDPGELGDPIPLSGLVTLPAVEPRPQPDGTWQGQVLHIDHFGNLITNFTFPMATDQIAVVVGEQLIVGLSRTFADVEPGELVAYRGSSGYLEIAIREGSASEQVGITVGDAVQIEAHL